MARNAHERPPEALRIAYKKFQKLGRSALDEHDEIIDFHRGLSSAQELKFVRTKWLDEGVLTESFDYFVNNADPAYIRNESNERQVNKDYSTDAYVCKDLPDLIVIPSLVPLNVQKVLLSRLFHRDLNNKAHNTNVHFHHNVEYPPGGTSFFDQDPACDTMVTPKDAFTHKPMSVQQFLNKKLRWMLLGGQYDWTAKQYPDEEPPVFPKDIARLLHGLFPNTESEAAIVNLYSPGDTLSLHRDVSEESDKGLISLSIGCEGLFMIGEGNNAKNANSEPLMLRLHSGDAVYMAGTSRFAWHGVPLIVRDTCPKELLHWPMPFKDDGYSNVGQLATWAGWMASKRINLNVRQMR